MNDTAPASLNSAVALVDQTAAMSASEATRYLFDRYRTSSEIQRDAIVLALVSALCVARARRVAA